MIRFFKDDKGAMAVAFAVSLLPLVGLAGLAVDYTRSVTVRQKLQAAADTAALAGAAASTSGEIAKVTQFAEANVTASIGSYPKVTGTTVTAAWLSPTDFKSTSTTNVGNMLLSGLPGMAKSMTVSATAVARLYQPILVSQSPSITQLDPEAADYNVISVYCYNVSQKNQANKGRSQFTVIADNANTKYTFTMPTCAPGETISYRLRNVRNMRTTPSKWNDPKAEQYNYYTDTTIEGYTQTYNMGGQEILETVLCDTLSSCKGKSKGGILTEGKNRTPQVATGACEPGKYMYYGWEDRPPGAGWTDRDYDDIRIVVACPTITRGAKQVFLIK